MNVDRELFIFGEPQEIELNEMSVKFRFLTYKEHILHMHHLIVISYDTLHWYYQYKKVLDSKDKELMNELEELKKESLFSIVRQSPDIIESYLTVLQLKLDSYSPEEIEYILPLIFENEEVFSFVRTLVLEMEAIVEDEVSPNPEVQKGIEISRKLKSEQNKDSPGLSDVLTSIVAGTAVSFKELQNMTAIQVNSLYRRIGAFKDYDTSILFATVSPDVSIESWGRRIDLYEKESSSISRKEFDGKYGSLLQ